MLDVEAFAEQMVGAGYSRKTCVCYLAALRTAEAWLLERGTNLDSAGAVMVRTFAETLPFSRSSRGGLRSALGCYWRLSGRSEVPLGAVRVPRQRRMKCKALELEQARRLADT